MVGIVIVSHSFRIAEGVAELAREMGGPDVRLETAGGLDLPEHPVGTDAVLVMQAIDRAWSEDGVLVLMDLGSAVLSAEMALDLMDQDRRALVQLCEAPLVEGAVAAAVTAKLGADLDGVAKEAREGLAGKLAHLGAPPQTQSAMETARAAGPVASTELTVENPHGLHARPAARFVQTASAFDADVSVRNMTTGRGPADATSLNGVAMLAVTSGHRIEITATGPQAQEAIDALERLAARRFDEPDGAGGEPIGEPVPAVRAAAKGVLTGHPASPGIAIGAARRPHVGAVIVPEGGAEDPASELRTLARGIADASDDLRRQREDVAARAGDAEAEIFDAHLLFLRDEALLAPTRRAIEADGRTAAQAWQGVTDATAQMWDALDDEYLRARAADLRSVGTQVLAHLVGVEPPSPRLEAPGILVTADLAPADTVSLDPSLVVGIATARGGPTSHAAVLARALGIPAVVGLGDLLLEVAEGTPLVLDGERGEVIVSPSAEQGQQARAAMEMRAVEFTRARDAALTPAVTLDGTPIEVGANVGRPGEVAAAVEGGADSVGLFRTEVLFMGRDRMPDEDEQVEAYRAAAVALAGRPLTIRTLDAGADKPIPYLSQPHEDNPFLGVRGIRLGLDRPTVLETQCRAIVRVGAEHPVRVMFPMVATLHELRRRGRSSNVPGKIWGRNGRSRSA